MESFFLAETTKYLYLLFDPDNFIHADSGGPSGIPHQVASRTCLLDAGGYIFNTEAHPLDAGALDCCYGPTKEEVWRDVWFPTKKQVDPRREFIKTTYEKCNALPWTSVFLLGKNTRRTARSMSNSTNRKGSSSLNSLLTCDAAPFLERRCIEGEVCDH